MAKKRKLHPAMKARAKKVSQTYKHLMKNHPKFPKMTPAQRFRLVHKTIKASDVE